MPLNRAPRNSLNLQRRRRIAEGPACLRRSCGRLHAAAILVAPMCIFLMPEHFYLVALPLCAFMVILIRGFPREPRPLGSARDA